MSHQLTNLVRAVNEEIAASLPTLKSEKSRIAMRANLKALSRMCLDIRKQLMEESKQLKNSRKQQRENNKKNNKNNSNNIKFSNNIREHDEEEGQDV